jgi:hypothetical protein
MRRTMLFGSFLALVAALAGLWAYRFERVPGLPVWRLADLQAAAPVLPGVEWTGTPADPAVRLWVDAGNPQLAVRLALPGIPPVDMLHVRFRMSSRGLIPGPEKWDDGRLLVEWHPPDGGPGWENDQCHSIRYDHASEEETLVMHPLRAPAVPALRIEHLGHSGEFDLANLEITVVRERAVWKIGRWFLVIGWLAWGIAFLRSWPGIGWWRALGAAAVWLLMGIYCVVPGPWKSQRAMGPDFRLGTGQAALTASEPAPMAAATAQNPLRISSGAVPVLGKIPDQGTWMLKVKHRLAQARPLLHALLLFGPALAMALLVGRKPALALMVIFALATELAQIAFGYGFTLLDIGDLACDAAGIALALGVYQKISRKTKP